MTDNPRIIGERSGSQHGPLLIVLTQVHGNEPAGYLAIKEVFKRIDEEYWHKPHFDYRGKIVGLIGNMAAAKKGVRFIDTDLNRLWTDINVARITTGTKSELKQAEEQELFDIIDTVKTYIRNYEPKKIIILDLHTTTAQGGIFIIPSKDEKSRQLGLHIHAPILHGFLDDLEGTSLHHFCQKNYPDTNLSSLCFESGQHNSPDSIDHAVSAIIQCFMAMGGFYPEDIETKHEQLLTQDSAKLPKEAQLVYSHRIMPGDDFKMREDKIYGNFDPVKKGELLAFDRHGEIRSKCDGLILMPLYQKQGNDGFFIIKDINKNAPRLHRKIPSTTLNA
jgi:succinylglutamate desuccinylase